MSDENMETPKDLREALARAEARAAEAEKTANAAQSELRQYKATVTFEKSGLLPKHAELFLKANPDAEVTPEAVSDFAHEYGLVTEAAPPSTEEPKSEGGNPALSAFQNAGGGGTEGAAPAAQPKMSREEFDALLASNPAAAAEAYVKGTAPRNSLNTQARDLVNKGIIDH